MKHLVNASISVKLNTTFEADDDVDINDKDTLDDKLFDKICNMGYKKAIDYFWEECFNNGCIVYTVDSDK